MEKESIWKGKIGLRFERGRWTLFTVSKVFFFFSLIFKYYQMKWHDWVTWTRVLVLAISHRHCRIALIFIHFWRTFLARISCLLGWLACYTKAWGSVFYSPLPTFILCTNYFIFKFYLIIFCLIGYSIIVNIKQYKYLHTHTHTHTKIL